MPMNKKYILSIDQGTTSSRAIIFDKAGNTKSIYQMEFSQIRRADGFVEHNACEIYETVLECIKNAINIANIKALEIDSIGITNQRETAVLFSKETGLPVCNAICWQSRQSKDICDKLINDGYEDTIFKKTGLHINPYFSASKIRYMLDNNKEVLEMYNKDLLYFGTIDTYLLYRLTEGRSFYTDYTNASRTMLFNINTLEYDDDLLKLFNLKKSILPKVLNSSDDFGYYTINGINIPITGIAGDQQASLFGHAAFNKGNIKNTYGTGCFMLENIGENIFFSDKGLITTIAYKIDDKPVYALEGSVFIGGAVVSWLRDGLRVIESSKETEVRIKDTIDDSLVFVPTFVGLGTPYWENDVRGAMFGISQNTTQESIIKASLESIAFQSKDLMDIMAKSIDFDKTSISVDGGASANNYLMQFQADILDSVVKRPFQTETTALGVAFLAGLKTGFYKNLEELAKINKTQKMFYPAMDKTRRLSICNKWNKALELTRKFK